MASTATSLVQTYGPARLVPSQVRHTADAHTWPGIATTVATDILAPLGGAFAALMAQKKGLLSRVPVPAKATELLGRVQGNPAVALRCVGIVVGLAFAAYVATLVAHGLVKFVVYAWTKATAPAAEQNADAHANANANGASAAAGGGSAPAASQQSAAAPAAATPPSASAPAPAVVDAPAAPAADGAAPAAAPAPAPAPTAAPAPAPAPAPAANSAGAAAGAAAAPLPTPKDGKRELDAARANVTASEGRLAAARKAADGPGKAGNIKLELGAVIRDMKEVVEAATVAKTFAESSAEDAGKTERKRIAQEALTAAITARDAAQREHDSMPDTKK